MTVFSVRPCAVFFFVLFDGELCFNAASFSVAVGSGDKPPVEWDNSRHTSTLGFDYSVWHVWLDQFASVSSLA